MSLPPWAAALLRRLAPPDRAEDVIGDLEEIHRKRLDHRHRAVATALTCLETLDMAWALVRSRWPIGSPLAGVAQDVRVGIRLLARDRLFTFVTILTLAVGIGADTAIFSVVDGVLLRPLPYPNAGRLVTVETVTTPQVNQREVPFSDAGYWLFQNESRAFASFGAYEAGAKRWPLVRDGPPAQVDVGVMTRSVFELLGTRPILGRLPTQEEDLPNGPLVAIMSEGLWRDRYGSDPGVVGRVLDLNGLKYEVVGVLPRSYDYPTPDIDVWVPAQLDPSSTQIGAHHLHGIGRLAPGVTMEAAQEDAERLIARFDEIGYGPVWSKRMFNGKAAIRELREQIVGHSRRPLIILLGAMSFVLLVSCINVANLLVVRTEARARENAVRLALGSGRARLIRYVLVESTLLSMVAGALGVFVAWMGTRILVAAAPARLPRLEEINVNWTVLAFTAAVSLGSGLLFAVLPAMRVAGGHVVPALSGGGGRPTAGPLRLKVRSVLVVVQVALALVLCVGAGLMIQSFRSLGAVDLGFEPEEVMTFRISPPPTAYPPGEPVARFYDQLVEGLEAIPGVISVSGLEAVPLTPGGPRLMVSIDEFPVQEGDLLPTFGIRHTMPGYFSTMGIPVLEGRALSVDDRKQPGSIVISDSIKRRFWPDVSALGKQISLAGRDETVVGVVGDVRDAGLAAPPRPVIYTSVMDPAAGGVRAMTIVVRSEGDPHTLAEAIRATVSQLDPDLPVTDLRPMQDVVRRALSRTTFMMSLLVLAGSIALLLASVGLYGVISYVATQRTAEVGVRMALGADAPTVRWLFLRQGILLSAAGVALGIAGASLLGGVLKSQLYGIAPTDPLTTAAVATVLMAVAVVASLVPAVRASRTQPAEAIRGG